MNDKWELKVIKSFAAAHYLREYQGSCERMHGHNYRVETVVVSEKLNKTGFVMDFKDIKKILKPVLDKLDHQCLNDVTPFDNINPTAENIGAYISSEIAEKLPEGVKVKEITIWETDGCAATFKPCS